MPERLVAEVFMSGSIVGAGEPTTLVEGQARYVETFEGKSRVFVLTDIGNEPDDQMSLTRFLLYADDFDVEGLVAVTSTWQREKVSPEIIQRVLSNYGKIRPNLLKHCDGFPAVEDLAQVVKSGQPGYGMAAIGQGRQLSPVADRSHRSERPSTGLRDDLGWGEYSGRGFIGGAREALL
jgi:Protein of unknown function (DUF1593)